MAIPIQGLWHATEDLPLLLSLSSEQVGNCPINPQNMKSPAPKRVNQPFNPPKTNNYISWFEIPAQNIHRAISFYDQIYDIEMEIVEMNGYSMAFFPAVNGIGGAVIAGEGCYPSDRGPILYLNAGNDLNKMLEKVDAAGGRVLMGKTLINKESGYFALFLDTEGNKLALHSHS